MMWFCKTPVNQADSWASVGGFFLVRFPRRYCSFLLPPSGLGSSTRNSSTFVRTQVFHPRLACLAGNFAALFRSHPLGSRQATLPSAKAAEFNRCGILDVLLLDPQLLGPLHPF